MNVELRVRPGPTVRSARLFRGRVQLELEVLDVREADLLQAASAAAAVLEVHILERFGSDLLQALVADALFLGVEKRAAYCGGSATVRCRRRSSSVVPIGAL